MREFPAFRVEADGEARTLGGYQSFDRLEEALVELAPGLERRELPSVEAFVRTYGYVATREVTEVYEWSPGKVEQVLGELSTDGDVHAVDRGNGTFWTPTDGDYSDRLGTGELSLGGDLEWDV
jgi:hypothetical protein